MHQLDRKIRKTANCARHQNLKPAVFNCENRENEPKIGHIGRLTENPNCKKPESKNNNYFTKLEKHLR